jgi:hypothetical protein
MKIALLGAGLIALVSIGCDSEQVRTSARARGLEADVNPLARVYSASASGWAVELSLESESVECCDPIKVFLYIRSEREQPRSVPCSLNGKLMKQGTVIRERTATGEPQVIDSRKQFCRFADFFSTDYRTGGNRGPDEDNYSIDFVVTLDNGVTLSISKIPCRVKNVVLKERQR